MTFSNTRDTTGLLKLCSATDFFSSLRKNQYQSKINILLLQRSLHKHKTDRKYGEKIFDSATSSTLYTSWYDQNKHNCKSYLARRLSTQRVIQWQPNKLNNENCYDLRTSMFVQTARKQLHIDFTLATSIFSKEFSKINSPFFKYGKIYQFLSFYRR